MQAGRRGLLRRAATRHIGLAVHGFRRSLTWDANIQERLRM